VITWPSEGLADSTATASPETATVVTTVAGYERKVEFAGFINWQTQIFGFSALKARHIHVDGVDADGSKGSR